MIFLSELKGIEPVMLTFPPASEGIVIGCTWRWDGERMAWVIMHDSSRPEMVHPDNLLLINETH